MNPHRTTPTAPALELGTVLAVVAHPDNESFGLGGIIARFVARGSTVDVLCLTQGEASTLGTDTVADGAALALVRAEELRLAGDALGVRSVTLLDHPDGVLADVPQADLVDAVRSAAAEHGSTSYLVMDRTGISGHPDHVAATEAALVAAAEEDRPVLAWTLAQPLASQLVEETGVPFVGRPADEVAYLGVDREAQLRAIRAHVSQAVPGSVLWRRLELSGGRDAVVWLRRPTADEGTAS